MGTKSMISNEDKRSGFDNKMVQLLGQVLPSKPVFQLTWMINEDSVNWSTIEDCNRMGIVISFTRSMVGLAHSGRCWLYGWLLGAIFGYIYVLNQFLFIGDQSGNFLCMMRRKDNEVTSLCNMMINVEIIFFLMLINKLKDYKTMYASSYVLKLVYAFDKHYVCIINYAKISLCNWLTLSCINKWRFKLIH